LPEVSDFEAFMMNEWMKQRDLLIQETMEFVQEVAANSKIVAPLVQQVVEANKPQIPLEAKDPAPTDKLDMERADILRRVANFKANQRRFQREREEYFAGTMAKARANQWTPQTLGKRWKSASNKDPAGTAL
jgi:hypothetical protein